MTPRTGTRTRIRAGRSLGLVAGITAIGLGLAACASPASSGTSPSPSSAPALGPAAEGSTALPEETAELEEQYEKALAEGGTLTVWAGGDAPNQQDALAEQFRTRFPGVDIEMTVDLSKDHDARIDKQLADKTLETDVAMLQTTFDFDRWKEQGELLEYRPKGAEKQLAGYADPDGAYLTAFMLSFLPTYDPAKVPAQPSGYEAYLAPEFTDKLVLTPPHDDDAVLYVYEKIREKYGDEFLTRLAAQNPEWVRGTAAPAAMVGNPDFDLTGNLTGYATGEGESAQAFIPEEDPFIVWNQRAAVFQQAKNPEAGKLFLAFVASSEFQSTYEGWRTRADVGVADGLKPIEDYNNTDPQGFIDWMADREGVEAAKADMEKAFGPVEGESPLTDPRLLKILGITPSGS